jgi:uncharacterized protein
MPGSLFIDSDRHVIEPFELWQARLPRHLMERAPREQDGVILFEGRDLFENVSPQARAIVTRQATARHADLFAASHGHGQLDSMDRQQIDVAYLYPTYALYVAYVEGTDPELSSALVAAYNDWLFDYCSADPQRLRGVGMIDRNAPDEMLRELERVRARGWRAVVLRPNPVGGRTLGHPSHEPFWTACAEHGVAVALHEGTQARVATVGADRFTTRFAQHACSHPMEQMLGFLSLLESGVLERHPSLRFGLLESGAGWLAPFLWRLDRLSYPHMREEVALHVRELPSSYFRRQCWISFEPGEPGLELAQAAVGGERFLYGSDYPHPDHETSPIRPQLAATPGSAALFDVAVGENACRFYEAPPVSKS